MTCIAMGLTGVASMIRVFGEERVQYWREASGLSQPWHTIAYFFGKDLSMLPQMLLAPMVYCIVYLSITSPRCVQGLLGLFRAKLHWFELRDTLTSSFLGFLRDVTL